MMMIYDNENTGYLDWSIYYTTPLCLWAGAVIAINCIVLIYDTRNAILGIGELIG